MNTKSKKSPKPAIPEAKLSKQKLIKPTPTIKKTPFVKRRKAKIYQPIFKLQDLLLSFKKTLKQQQTVTDNALAQYINSRIPKIPNVQSTNKAQKKIYSNLEKEVHSSIQNKLITTHDR